MLVTKKLDQSGVCADCRAPIALCQINGKTVAVELQSAFVGGSLVVLEIHRCRPSEDPRPQRPRRQF
jgi:hypothetical protein